MIPNIQELAVRSSDVTLLTALAAGTAVSLSLCAVVRLPIVVAYVAGAARSKRHGVVLSILFVLGLIAGTALLGTAATSTDEGLRRILGVNKYLFWGLGAALFVAGVLFSGLVNPHLLPEKWQRVAQRLASTGSPGAFLLGSAFGLLQTPACPNCGTAIQTLSEAASGSAPHGFVLFMAFAAGQGFILLAVGVLFSLAMPRLLVTLRTRMCSVEQRIQLLAGNMLMILGVYFVIVS
ncbi:MAG: cytochrome c biogenesis protein CcdA [Phycisphaerales bacterium]